MLIIINGELTGLLLLCFLYNFTCSNWIILLFLHVQGGISARVVNSVLALKSYYEWKQTGGTGVWKFGGNVKPTTTVKQFVRTKSEPFTNSLIRNPSLTEKSLNALSHDIDTNKMVSTI